jgi:hypothetical protein
VISNLFAKQIKNMKTKLLPYFIYVILLCQCSSDQNKADVFTLNIPAEYFNENVSSAWVFVSDSKGNLIDGIKPLVESTTLSFYGDKNLSADEKFTLHIFQSGYDEDGPVNSMESYPGLARGIYGLKGTPQPKNSSVRGSSVITVNNLSLPNDWLLSSHGLSSFTLTSLDNSCKFTGVFSESTNSVFMALRVGSMLPVFKKFDALNTGENTEIDFNGMESMTMSLQHTDSKPFFYISTSMADAPSDSDDWISTWNHTSNPGLFDESNIHMFYPGNSFSEYSFKTFFIDDDNRNYYYRSYGQTPVVDLQKLDADVTGVVMNGQELKVSQTGKCDYISIGASLDTKPNSVSTRNYWTVYFESGSSESVMLPEIPSEILNTGFPARSNFYFSTVSLFDYKSLNGYSDFVEFQFKKSSPYLKSDFRSVQFSVVPSGGRVNVKAEVEKLKNGAAKYGMRFIENYLRIR